MQRDAGMPALWDGDAVGRGMWALQTPADDCPQTEATTIAFTGFVQHQVPRHEWPRQPLQGPSIALRSAIRCPDNAEPYGKPKVWGVLVGEVLEARLGY